MRKILKLTWQLMKITDMPLTAPHTHSPNFVQTDHITIAWWPASQIHKLPKFSPQPYHVHAGQTGQLVQHLSLPCSLKMQTIPLNPACPLICSKTCPAIDWLLLPAGVDEAGWSRAEAKRFPPQPPAGRVGRTNILVTAALAATPRKAHTSHHQQLCICNSGHTYCTAGYSAWSDKYF